MEKISSLPEKLRLVLMILVLTFISGGCGLDQKEQIVDGNEPFGELRVLFIGNSYTFANELPDIFVKIANESGYRAEVTMLAKGGWTLSKHAQSNRTIKTIRDQTWDYVILQEQSVIPAKIEEREQSMLPAIRTLDAEIRNNGAKTILFMTWGRREGLPQEGFADFYEMQAAIAEGYREISNELNVALAPVGDAWKIGVDEGTQLELWAEDGSHPSIEGSYLSAWLIYAIIFDVSPKGVAHLVGLKEDSAHLLQTYADRAVFQD